MRTWRVVWLVGLVGLPTFALANGAMGLGLEMWDLGFWFVYVLATVVFEGWYIGKRLDMPWWQWIGYSLVANFLTGFFCGGLGLCAPFLHTSFVGTITDPNPLANAIVLLATFAIPSALVEVFVWNIVRKRSGSDISEMRLLGRTLLAHLIGIPLGLAILLIPSRPYVGMERFTNARRFWAVRGFMSDLNDYIQEHKALPKARTLDALLKEVPETGSRSFGAERALGLYRAEFGRFDLGESYQHPMELQTELAGRAIPFEETSNPADDQWYLKPAGQEPDWRGIKVDLKTGKAHIERYPYRN